MHTEWSSTAAQAHWRAHIHSYFSLINDYNMFDIRYLVILFHFFFWHVIFSVLCACHLVCVEPSNAVISLKISAGWVDANWERKISSANARIWLVFFMCLERNQFPVVVNIRSPKGLQICDKHTEVKCNSSSSVSIWGSGSSKKCTRL